MAIQKLLHRISLVSAMSTRKTSLTDKQAKNGTSKYVLERCASINEYYDVAFKVRVSVLSVSFFCMFFSGCRRRNKQALGECAPVLGTLTYQLIGFTFVIIAFVNTKSGSRWLGNLLDSNIYQGCTCCFSPEYLLGDSSRQVGDLFSHLSSDV